MAPHKLKLTRAEDFVVGDIIEDFGQPGFLAAIRTIETLPDGRLVVHCLLAHQHQYVANVDFVMHPDEGLRIQVTE